MFRERDPQVRLWQSEFLVPPKKARRLERSWAEVFRNEALPQIDEERFAPMYCADNGRPNRAVQTVLGVHLLKEMFNLTDDEALEQLEFNLLWHHALRLDMEETHLPQKTLHNFRVRLMQHRWPAGFPGDHGADHPGAGYTHRKAAAGLHPHHEPSPPSPDCSVRRCGCSFGP